MPSPRPSGTTSAPWSCGREVPRAAERPGSTGSSCSSRRPPAAHLAEDARAGGRCSRQALAGWTRRATRCGPALLHERLGRYLWLSLDDGRPGRLRGGGAAWSRPSRHRPSGPGSWPGTPSPDAGRGGARRRRAAEEALAIARTGRGPARGGPGPDILGVHARRPGDLEQGLGSLRRPGDRRGAGRRRRARLGQPATWLAHREAGRLEEALAAALDGAEATGRSARAGDGRASWPQLAASVRVPARPLGGRPTGTSREALEREPAPAPARAHPVSTGQAGHRPGRLRRRAPLAPGGRAAGRQGRPCPVRRSVRRPAGHARAELALWEGRDDDAFAGEPPRGWRRWPVPSADEDRASRLLFALGLAAAADRAERAPARRASGRAEAARRDGDQLLARLEATGDRPDARARMTAAVLAQCRAEQSRLHGRPDPAGWAAAAAELGGARAALPGGLRPLPAGRGAAGRPGRRGPEIQPVLRAAHEITVRLGAGPLRRELELLAQRGRLRLEPPAEPAGRPSRGALRGRARSA